jgi:hypothetical protein
MRVREICRARSVRNGGKKNERPVPGTITERHFGTIDDNPRLRCELWIFFLLSVSQLEPAPARPL